MNRIRTAVLAALVLAVSSCNSLGGRPSVAGEPIPDFPDYPGATRTGYSQAGPKDGFAKVVKAEYESSDAFDAVRAHYQNAITGGGWQVTKSEVKADKAEWSATKGTSAVEIEVDQKTSGVKIEIERKDR